MQPPTVRHGRANNRALGVLHSAKPSPGSSIKPLPVRHVKSFGGNRRAPPFSPIGMPERSQAPGVRLRSPSGRGPMPGICSPKFAISDSGLGAIEGLPQSSFAIPQLRASSEELHRRGVRAQAQYHVGSELPCLSSLLMAGLGSSGRARLGDHWKAG